MYFGGYAVYVWDPLEKKTHCKYFVSVSIIGPLAAIHFCCRPKTLETSLNASNQSRPWVVISVMCVCVCVFVLLTVSSFRGAIHLEQSSVKLLASTNSSLMTQAFQTATVPLSTITDAFHVLLTWHTLLNNLFMSFTLFKVKQLYFNKNRSVVVVIQI